MLEQELNDQAAAGKELAANNQAFKEALMRCIKAGDVAACGNQREQQTLLQMAEKEAYCDRQTQHQRLPQCVVDFRVVNQPAPHRGKTKTACCRSNTPFYQLNACRRRR